MARLQILQLPEGAGDDRPPYVLVVVQVPSDEAKFDAIRRDLLSDGDLAPRLGATAVLCFEETVSIPANEPLPLPLPPPSAETDDEPDSADDVDYTEMIETVDRVLGINSGRGKPDVAGWLLTACRELEKSEAAREHLRRELDGIPKAGQDQRKAALTDALGMDPLRDWDDIYNTAAGLRKERDALKAAAAQPTEPVSIDVKMSPLSKRDVAEAVRQKLDRTERLGRRGMR